jgi:hypothetical protein
MLSYIIIAICLALHWFILLGEIEILDFLRIIDPFNPCLKVSDNVLIVQSTKYRDLSFDSLIFLMVFSVQANFLDGVNISIDLMPCKVDSTRATFSNFVCFFKI